MRVPALFPRSPWIRSRRPLLPILAVFVWLPIGASAIAGPDPVATMQKIVRDLDLQDMPQPEAPPPPHATWHIPHDVAQIILIGAILIAVGTLLYSVRETLPRWPRAKVKRETAPNASSVVAHVARMESAGADADALAAAGRYGEAMHVLLLRSLVELRQRLPLIVTDALTSREILQRSALPGEGPHALRDLIDRVEIVHFGRRAAMQADYQACRASYGRLLSALRTQENPA